MDPRKDSELVSRSRNGTRQMWPEPIDPLSLLSGRRRRQPGRTHEGHDLVGSGKEKQTIGDRRRREVVGVPAERYRDDLVTTAGLEACTLLPPIVQTSPPAMIGAPAAPSLSVQSFRMRALAQHFDGRHAVGARHVDD